MEKNIIISERIKRWIWNRTESVEIIKDKIKNTIRSIKRRNKTKL
jgi:hypothetical protein